MESRIDPDFRDNWLSSNGCGWVEARSAGRRGVLAARVASELTAHGVHLTGGGRGAPWPGVGRSGVAAGDVGSYYAGKRDFFFSLLVVDPEKSPLGAVAVARYSDSDFAETRALLHGHRPDRLANLRAVTLLTWSDMAAVLADARDSIVRIDEQHYADRALEWMQAKGLVG